MSFKKFMTGFLAIALIALAAPAIAQDEVKDPMQANLDKKLSSPFLKKGGWYTDFEEAKKASKAQGVPIFAYFTRSYSP